MCFVKEIIELLNSNQLAFCLAFVRIQVIMKNEITIKNGLVTKDSLIYITPRTNLPNLSLFLLRQNSEIPDNLDTEGSFTVGISQGINKKVPFNWIIIN